MLSSKANLSKKLMLASRNKQKKNNIIGYCCTPKNKFLITINVLGCAGPLRFVVNEDDVVDSVIDTALKLYARQGRVPVLVTHTDDFLLYCANAEFEGTSTHLFPETFPFFLNEFYNDEYYKCIRYFRVLFIYKLPFLLTCVTLTHMITSLLYSKHIYHANLPSAYSIHILAVLLQL